MKYLLSDFSIEILWGKIKDTVPKTVLSTLIIAIPIFLLKYYYVVYLSSLFQIIYGCITVPFILEHFYRKLCKGLKREQIGVFTDFNPVFYWKAVGIVTVVCGIKNVNLLFNSWIPFDSEYFCMIFYNFTVSAIYFIEYFSNMTYIAYGTENNLGFLEGIKKAFAVIYENIIFFIVLAGINLVLVNVLSVGYILTALLLIVTEPIKVFMYSHTHNIETNKDRTFYNGEEFCNYDWDRY